MTGKYNFIYEKLVTAEDDLVGLIAYGIYKKHKIEFITKIKGELQRDPTEEECRSFFAASTTESQLGHYRSQAETMLLEMVGNIAGEEIREYEKEMLREYKKEISACNEFIERAIGVKPVLFAPPSGAYNENTLNACKQLQMKTVLWSRDTIDWRDKNSALIYTRATKDIKNGDFILMHPMKETADALSDILDTYEKQSLTTVTVSENLQGKG